MGGSCEGCRMQSLLKETEDDEGGAEKGLQLMGAFDEQKLISVIYLAVLGANKN